MKKLRNYRIKLRESDDIECILYEMVGDSTSNSFNVIIDNISTTGIGVLIGEYVDSQIFKIEIRFKKNRLMQTVRLRRYRPNINNNADNYLGLEFVDYQVESIMKLMSDLVSSMSRLRLRDLMYDMVLNEAVAGNFDDSTKVDSEDEVSTSMILDLFHIFKNFENKIELIKLFIIEVQRVVRARDARAFIVGHDEHTFSEFDFQKNELHDIEYPIVGILEQLYNNPRGIKSKFSQSLSSDEFFNMYEVVNNTTISTYMMCPIFDQNENIFGILNFSNKEKGELFTENDLKQAMFLARVIGLLYFYNKDDEIDYEDEFLDAQGRASTPLGVSLFATQAQNFIAQHSGAKKTGPVYIYGDEGSGKYHLCEKIAHFSNTKNTRVEIINATEKMTKVDLEAQIEKIRDKLVGGHLVIKGFDKLSRSVAKYVLNHLVDNGSYRVLLTGNQFLEDFNISSFKTVPLKDRKEDILYFANFFITQYSLKNHTAKKRISNQVQEILLDYDWPGNISELKACIARLMIFNKGSGNLHIRTSEIAPLFEIDSQPQISLDANDLNIRAFEQHDLSKQQCADLYLYFYVAKQLKDGAVGLKSVASDALIDYDEIVKRLANGSKVVKSLFDATVDRVELYLNEDVA